MVETMDRIESLNELIDELDAGIKARQRSLQRHPEAAKRDALLRQIETDRDFLGAAEVIREFLLEGGNNERTD